MEVISLSHDTLETACTGQGSCLATVEIKRYSLSTQYQPVSVVITGDFVFDSVSVKDDTSHDFIDEPYSSEIIWTTVVAAVVYVFAAKS